MENNNYSGCSAIIFRKTDKKVFIGQRKLTKYFGAGQWETVGGSIETGEDFVSCIKREIKEELNSEVKDIKEFNDYEKDQWKIKTFIVELQNEPDPNPNDFENFGWFSKDEIEKLDFVSNCKQRIIDFYNLK